MIFDALILTHLDALGNGLAQLSDKLATLPDPRLAGAWARLASAIDVAVGLVEGAMHEMSKARTIGDNVGHFDDAMLSGDSSPIARDPRAYRGKDGELRRFADALSDRIRSGRDAISTVKAFLGRPAPIDSLGFPRESLSPISAAKFVTDLDRVRAELADALRHMARATEAIRDVAPDAGSQLPDAHHGVVPAGVVG